MSCALIQEEVLVVREHSIVNTKSNLNLRLGKYSDGRYEWN
jgi:hypothetical protein